MPPTTAAIRRFADQFSGEIIRRGDPGYDDARVVWNGMIDRYPEVVARPTNADDVVAAVRFGREEELPIAVRSGGHSIPGLSTCDDGIVIDLSRMNGARVDAAERTAWVNGGALLGELDREAQAVGLVCPVGVVSHTGVAGLTLGGGMGRLQRKHGYTIDNLLGVELVTADGRQVRAERRGERGPLLGAPRGRRQLRDRDSFPLPSAPARLAGHARDARPPDRAGRRARRLLQRAHRDRARRAVGRASRSGARRTAARPPRSPSSTAAVPRRPSATSQSCAHSARRSAGRSTRSRTSTRRRWRTRSRAGVTASR